MDSSTRESHIISQLLIVVHVVKVTSCSFKIQIILQVDAPIKTKAVQVNIWCNIVQKLSPKKNVKDREMIISGDHCIVNGTCGGMRCFSKKIMMKTIILLNFQINCPFGRKHQMQDILLLMTWKTILFLIPHKDQLRIVATCVWKMMHVNHLTTLITSKEYHSNNADYIIFLQMKANFIPVASWKVWQITTTCQSKQ